MELMLRRLPARHREIIVATYFRRRTTREAARRLGVTPAAATARLYHAMSDLSRMVAAYHPAAPATVLAPSMSVVSPAEPPRSPARTANAATPAASTRTTWRW